MAAWTAGKVDEWRVTLLARETACLPVADRLTIDAELAADPTVIEAMGVGELVAEVRRRAYALDPESFVERRRRAEADRHTSLRPAPDTMAILSALLSVKNGVAVHAALSAEADRLKAAGDPRSRGQIMADTLTSRVVSPSVAEAATGAPLMVNVIVSDQVLLGDPGTDGAAEVEGYGPVPGELLRSWITDHLEAGVDVFVRRLYETPATGALMAMDSKARLFPKKLAEFLRLRDRTLPHPLLRRPGPRRRPRHRPLRGRRDVCRQRPVPVRELQHRQGGLRLVRPTATGSAAHRRDHHTHRAHLHLGRAPAHSTPRPTAAGDGAGAQHRARGRLPLARRLGGLGVSPARLRRARAPYERGAHRFGSHR